MYEINIHIAMKYQFCIPYFIFSKKKQCGTRAKPGGN